MGYEFKSHRSVFDAVADTRTYQSYVHTFAFLKKAYADSLEWQVVRKLLQYC